MIYAIIGSRDYPASKKWKIKNWIDNNCNPGDTIVSGGALGVDRIAAFIARKAGLKVIEHVPDYATYGKQAPLIRNILIVKNVDEVIAFWDGESTGTLDGIKKAIKYGKEVRIIP